MDGAERLYREWRRPLVILDTPCHPEERSDEGPRLQHSWLITSVAWLGPSLTLGMTTTTTVIPRRCEAPTRDLAYGNRGWSGHGRGQPGASLTLGMTTTTTVIPRSVATRDLTCRRPEPATSSARQVPR